MAMLEEILTPYLKFVEQTAGSVPTPSTGQQHFFIDSADHRLKRKLSDASVVVVDPATIPDTAVLLSADLTRNYGAAGDQLRLALMNLIASPREPVVLGAELLTLNGDLLML